MIKPIQTESLKTILLVVCLALSLTACGENGDKTSIPEDIGKKYEEAAEKMFARRIAHSGDGPVFTEEELAEFDRLKQQFEAYKEAQREVARQQQLRAQYQTCVENQDTACPELVRFTSEGDREVVRVLTLGIHNSLPENITYQYYFGLTDEDCESDDPVNQWTDVDTVTVRYTGKAEPARRSFGTMALRQGQCHIQRQLQTPDIVFQSDEKVTFSYMVPPNVDDVLYVCEDRNSKSCLRFVTLEVNGAGELDMGFGHTAFEVKIINSLPEGIAYQHYFSLADIDGCISDGPIDQWTDTNSIEVRYNGEDMVHQKFNFGDDIIDGVCEVSMKLKITDTDLIFKPATDWGRYSKTPGMAKLEYSLDRGEFIHWDRQ